MDDAVLKQVRAEYSELIRRMGMLEGDVRRVSVAIDSTYAKLNNKMDKPLVAVTVREPVVRCLVCDWEYTRWSDFRQHMDETHLNYDG